MNTILHLRVLTGKKQFQLNWNQDKMILSVEIKSNPEKGKANKEIACEFKKFFKSEVKIVSGFKSKDKIVEIYSPENKVMETLSKHLVLKEFF